MPDLAPARTILGFLLGVIARLWLRTLRVTVDVSPALDAASERPWVLAFFHGNQWPLLAWSRRRPTAVIVSLSNDGAIQSRALSVLGFSIVRGSSSRGGARALAGIVRRLKRGDHDAAFAVDGPRGPYGVAKPGVVAATRAGRGVLVPMGSAVASGKVLRSWDRFTLAWPFSRVAVVLGAPLEVSPGDATLRDLEAKIAEANHAAQAILAAQERVVVRFSEVFGPSEPQPASRSPALNAEGGGPVQRRGA
jgi:lysophospholipid acyltransferase (LPLAT)-like uncharacterized protein